MVGTGAIPAVLIVSAVLVQAIVLYVAYGYLARASKSLFKAISDR